MLLLGSLSFDNLWQQSLSTCTPSKYQTHAAFESLRKAKHAQPRQGAKTGLFGPEVSNFLGTARSSHRCVWEIDGFELLVENPKRTSFERSSRQVSVGPEDEPSMSPRCVTLPLSRSIRAFQSVRDLTCGAGGGASRIQ